MRGKATICEVLSGFLTFLNEPDTILPAHSAGFDLGFLGFALAKPELPRPQHRIVDTLSLSQNCVRASRSYKLEDLAAYFGVAVSEDHRRSFGFLACEVGLFARSCRVRSGCGRPIEVVAADELCRRRNGTGRLPPGFECLAEAIEERRTVLLVYDGGTKGTAERRVTPRGIVVSGGRSYLCAFCHADGIEKSFRIERIRRFRLDEP